MKLNEIAQISVLPRLIKIAFDKSQQGGPKLLLLQPGTKITFTAGQVVKMTDVPATDGEVAKILLRFVWWQQFSTEYWWRELIKSPTLDDEWALTPKVIDDVPYVILHRATEETSNYVAKHLTYEHLLLQPD